MRILIPIILSFFALYNNSIANEIDFCAYQDSLTTRLFQGDLNIDFIKLRKVGIEILKDTNSTQRFLKFKENLLSSTERSSADSAIMWSDSVRSIFYGDARSHLVSMLAYQVKGNTAKMEYHANILAEIIKSIYDEDHDGSSPDKAFKVVEDDEIIVLAEYLNYEILGKVIQEKNGKSYTVLVGYDDLNNRELELYFEYISWKD